MTPLLTSAVRIASALADTPTAPLQRLVQARLDPRHGELLAHELQLGRLLLMVDGLDEVMDPSARDSVRTAIHTFAFDYPEAQVIVTSREPGHVPMGDQFHQLRLLPLSDESINRLIDALLTSVLGPAGHGWYVDWVMSVLDDILLDSDDDVIRAFSNALARSITGDEHRTAIGLAACTAMDLEFRIPLVELAEQMLSPLQSAAEPDGYLGTLETLPT
jgi:hypothetical protein